MAQADPTTKINEPIPALVRPGRPPKNGYAGGVKLASFILPQSEPEPKKEEPVKMSLPAGSGTVVNLTINTPGKVVIVIGKDYIEP